MIVRVSLRQGCCGDLIVSVGEKFAPVPYYSSAFEGLSAAI